MSSFPNSHLSPETHNLLWFLENDFQCKFRNFTSTLRFARSISCEISALGLNLKYKLKQYTFHFYPTKYTRQPKKINTEQLYFKGNIFLALRELFSTFNKSENYLLQQIYYNHKYGNLASICLSNHLTKSAHCYVKSACIIRSINYSIIMRTHTENQICKYTNFGQQRAFHIYIRWSDKYIPTTIPNLVHDSPSSVSLRLSNTFQTVVR